MVSSYMERRKLNSRKLLRTGTRLAKSSLAHTRGIKEPRGSNVLERAAPRAMTPAQFDSCDLVRMARVLVPLNDQRVG